jgi:proliferating cell nuclear antigen
MEVVSETTPVHENETKISKSKSKGKSASKKSVPICKNSFIAQMGTALVFKRVVEAMKELVDSISFDIQEEGIFVQAMDSSHVALVGLYFANEDFEDYYIDRPKCIGINLVNMSKLLKNVNNADALTLIMKAGNDDKIFLECTSKTRKVSMDFHLIEIDQEALSIPEFPETNVITMKSAHFSKLISDFGNISDTITINMTKTGVNFKSSGEIGSVDISMDSATTDAGDGGDETNLKIKGDGNNITQEFATKYIYNFTKGSSLNENVAITINQDMPINITYKFHRSSYLEYFLAPKIDENNNENQGAASN